jgi:hypothetical protein
MPTDHAHDYGILVNHCPIVHSHASKPKPEGKPPQARGLLIRCFRESTCMSPKRDRTFMRYGSSTAQRGRGTMQSMVEGGSASTREIVSSNIPSPPLAERARVRGMPREDVIKSREARSTNRARAREMRHSPVSLEKLYWVRLRDRRLGGYEFRRQYLIGPYIVDFVCTGSLSSTRRPAARCGIRQAARRIPAQAGLSRDED